MVASEPIIQPQTPSSAGQGLRTSPPQRIVEMEGSRDSEWLDVECPPYTTATGSACYCDVISATGCRCWTLTAGRMTGRYGLTACLDPAAGKCSKHPGPGRLRRRTFTPRGRGPRSWYPIRRELPGASHIPPHTSPPCLTPACAHYCSKSLAWWLPPECGCPPASPVSRLAPCHRFELALP